MKLLIASDIHGSEYYCRKLLEIYKEQGAQRLVLLGDLLYHGPRNDLPRDYNPRAVIKLLNEVGEELLCVRGNCDAEVDQMVLDFPMMADYAVLMPQSGAGSIYLTHGHIFNESNPPKLKNGDILLCGHTHIPACEEHESFIYMNPGSVSIPKNGSANSYMLYEDGIFRWLDFEGNEFIKYKSQKEG